MVSELETRRRKLSELRAAGIDPFPPGPYAAADIAKVRPLCPPEGQGPRVTVAGRILLRRDFGKAGFLTIEDWTGRIQLYAKKDILGDGFRTYSFLDIGDLVGCEGPLFRTKTGEITVQAERLVLLSKSIKPLPEKWHGLQDPDLRSRQRYLDLISNPDSRRTFLARSRLLACTREFLNRRGYVEVETPTMHLIPGGAAARPFVTHHNALNMDLFLRIALEIPLKKLLVGGIQKVYEIGRVFRNEGIDARHNPEFTMLELYHAYGSLDTMIELVESLIPHLAKEVTGSTTILIEDKPTDLAAPWPRLDYLTLIREKTGIDPANIGGLAARLKDRGIDTEKMSRIDILDKAFGEFVEPHLVGPAFVLAQPIEMTPLCRELASRPGYADRFEAYLGGMEIANAYNELNDPVVQRKRLMEQAGGDEMARAGKIDEDFLEAMEHGMPPAGGLGVGMDRVAMLLLGRSNVRDVLLFPLMKPT